MSKIQCDNCGDTEDKYDAWEMDYADGDRGQYCSEECMNAEWRQVQCSHKFVAYTGQVNQMTGIFTTESAMCVKCGYERLLNDE
jgi:hypothetical protein